MCFWSQNLKYVSRVQSLQQCKMQLLYRALSNRQCDTTTFQQDTWLFLICDGKNCYKTEAVTLQGGHAIIWGLTAHLQLDQRSRRKRLIFQWLCTLPSVGVCWKTKSFVVASGEAVQLLLRKQRTNPKLVVSVPHLRFPTLTTVCKVRLGGGSSV